jgi:Domain of unknown function (DUF4276)
MADLVFGFYGEEQIDYAFLMPLIARTLTQLVPDAYVFPYEIPEQKGLTQIEQLMFASHEGRGYNFIVVHLDADDASPDNAYQERFQPDLATVLKTSPLEYNHDLVPLIPVYMTEAWMLADFDAFREVIGTKLSPKELGFPEYPKAIEKISDPKILFRQAIAASRSGKHINTEEMYEPLARQITLTRLSEIPAYIDFRERLIKILESQHYL